MRSPLGRMLAYVKPHRRMLAVSTLLRILNLGLGVVLLGLAGYLVAQSVATGAVPTLDQWLVILAVGLAKAAARYAEQVTGHVAAFRILDTLRTELFGGFAARGSDERSTGRSGDIVSRAMADVELVEVFFAHTLAPVAAALVYVIAASTASGLLVGPAAGLLVAVLLLAAALLVPVVVQRIGLARGARIRGQAGELSAQITETLAGIQDLISVGAFDRRTAEVRGSGVLYARATASLAHLGALKTAVVDLLLVGSLVVVGWFGLAAPAANSPSIVWAIVAGMAGGFGAVLGVSRAVDDLPKSSAAAARILDVIGAEAPSAVPSTGARTALIEPEQRDTPALAVENLTFHYAGGNGVEHVSFRANPGEHLFVTGPSGSGKSTLGALLLRLIEPQDGTVLLGGSDAVQLSDQTFRSLVSAVPQDVGLVRGTVLDNLRMGLGQESMSAGLADLPVACHTVAELGQLLADLPEGEHTLIGGADEQISGGQKKRLAIARMIARDPRVIVLDEAFAGLDAALRDRVRDSLLAWAADGGRTLIECSHELADASDADRILVMHHGHVAESGTWDELRSRDGLFSSLLQAQQVVWA